MVTAAASITRSPIGITRIPIMVSLISLAPIFLPRYSGVRPTISPAMNTATTTNSSIPYMPEPTPPRRDLPQRDQGEGNRPAAAGEGVVAAVDRAGRGCRW